MHMEEITKNKRKFNLFEISIICLFWILLFASPLLFSHTKGVIDWNHVFKVWKGHSLLLILFLLNRFILVPFLFFRHRRAIYIITATLLIGVAATGMYFIDKKPQAEGDRRVPENNIERKRKPEPGQLPPGPPGQNGKNRTGRSQPEPVPAWINLLVLSVLVFGFDTGFKTASRWIYSEQQRIILEKENIETQLAYLRHQISPHFFMNTLNNIHALIDVDTVEAKKALIRLSSLMRHLLYESDRKLSPLKNEIEFIRSYVDLMKLRYSKDVRITLTIPDEIPEKSIPPLLFISLLENAFKHGISYLHDSFIDIDINFTGENLQLNITNSKTSEGADSTEAGIGIQNTRKRLDLLYKDSYTLDITDRRDIFITNLTIPV